MYYTEVGDRIKSVHLTRIGARDALTKHLESKSSAVMHIKSLGGADIARFIATMVMMVIIGVMLAWRG